MNRILLGDSLRVLRRLPEKSVHTCVTSPPYWGLRNYGVEGQLGLEKTPEEYVAKVVEIFREVRRVLRDDGTLWLNLGDSYNAYNGGAGPGSRISKNQTEQRPHLPSGFGLRSKSLKPKDLVGIPWRVAFALQADGWYLRSDIIWHKPNPMPESVKDRPTKAHEYIFLLAKNEKYFYDIKSIREPYKQETVARSKRSRGLDHKWISVPGQTPHGITVSLSKCFHPEGRNKRTVWTVTTRGYKGAHFATFPEKLIEPCVLAGCPKGGTVLDPFAGAGTTGVIAKKHERDFLGIELNPEYRQLALDRIKAA